MKLYSLQCLVMVLLVSGVGYAQQHPSLESTEPVKKPGIETKKPLVIYDDGPYGCPDGFDVYVKRIKPPVDKAHPESPNTDFQSYLFVADGNVLISRDTTKFVIACLREKK